MFKENRHDWDKSMLLRKGKNRSHKKIENGETIKDSKSIHEQNILFQYIKKTQEFGHLERDTLVGKDHKSSIITLADIWSKTIIPLCTKSHKSIDITESIINYIQTLPKGIIKTITFDCGK